MRSSDPYKEPFVVDLREPSRYTVINQRPEET